MGTVAGGVGAVGRSTGSTRGQVSRASIGKVQFSKGIRYLSNHSFACSCNVDNGNLTKETCFGSVFAAKAPHDKRPNPMSVQSCQRRNNRTSTDADLSSQARLKSKSHAQHSSTDKTCCGQPRSTRRKNDSSSDNLQGRCTNQARSAALTAKIACPRKNRRCTNLTALKKHGSVISM